MKKSIIAIILLIGIIISAVAAPQPLNDYSSLSKNQRKIIDEIIKFSKKNSAIVDVRKNNLEMKQLSVAIKGNSKNQKKVTYIYLINTDDRYSVTKDLKEKEAKIVTLNHNILTAVCKKGSLLYDGIIKKGGMIEWIYIYNHSLSNSYNIIVDKEICEEAKKFFKDIK